MEGITVTLNQEQLDNLSDILRETYSACVTPVSDNTLGQMLLEKKNGIEELYLLIVGSPIVSVK